MRLTRPEYSDGISTVTQAAFGGIDRRLSASDGAIIDSVNMTCEHYPVLSTRRMRSSFGQFFVIGEHYSLGGGENALLCVCDVADTPFYIIGREDAAGGVGALLVCVVDGQDVCERTLFEYSLSDGGAAWCGLRPTAVAYNRALVISVGGRLFRCTYDADAAELSCEEIGGSVDGCFRVTNRAGEYTRLEMDAHPSRDSRLTENFYEGMTILLRGEREDEESGDSIPYEIPVRVLSSDIDIGYDRDYKWILDIEYTDLIETDYEKGEAELSLRAKVPELSSICVCRDRVWGYYGNEIYASASCDARNWYSYEGTSADSFYAQIPEVSEFTAITSFGGYVYLFTREGAYCIYGTTPDAFTLHPVHIAGVCESERSSFGIITGGMCYNSIEGPVLFDGSGVRSIAATIPDLQLRSAIAVGHLSRYYVAQGSDVYVYDSQIGAWHRLSYDADVIAMLVLGGRVVSFDGDEALYIEADEDEQEWWPDSEMSSMVEFADISEGGLYGVMPCGFSLLAYLGEEARLTLSISYDGGEWQQIYTTAREGKHVHRVRFSPRERCSCYRLRLDGRGEWRLYSLSRSYAPCASVPYGE